MAVSADGRTSVLTVGIFQAGNRENIVPDQAELAGTLRTFNPKVRDLIMRPYFKSDTVTLQPQDTLADAYRKMKMYDVSQLPVLHDGKLLGLVNETDILLAISGNSRGFSMPVREVMAANLTTLQVGKPMEALLPIFERGMVAIVMDKEQFLGIITPIDLLQYLRKRVGHA